MNYGRAIGLSIAGAVLVIAAIGGMLWGLPQYNVYRLRMDGEAKLAESRASRQVLVSEAEAKKDAAKLLGEAKLIEAEYQAKAAKTVAAGLSEEYLKYVWLQEQKEAGDRTVIYLPTDQLGFPLMEAGRSAAISAPLTAPVIPKPKN